MKNCDAEIKRIKRQNYIVFGLFAGLIIAIVAVACICPVCWWENDVFIHSENEPSDENRGLTLSQARENYKKFGICDPELKLPGCTI